MKPDLTVVVPFYNRADTVAFTLESVARAGANLTVETILVDDGSTPPAAEQLRGQPHPPTVILRQANQGLVFARLTGLAAATGEHVLFLDSDDLVGPEKFNAQLAAMRAARVDVSYTDVAEAELRAPYDAITPVPLATLTEETSDAAEFFISIQPPPHSPIFRTDWLREIVRAPLFPPDAAYNPVAELWFYLNAAVQPAKVIKVPGAHTIVGHHAGPRLTNQWERLGVGSLAVMEAFDRACPQAHPARRWLGEKAFRSWRALPYDFNRRFDRRILGLWRRNPHGNREALGGRRFRQLARWLGPVLAGRFYRRFTGRSYRTCRTVDDPGLIDQWLGRLPAA